MHLANHIMEITVGEALDLEVMEDGDSLIQQIGGFGVEVGVVEDMAVPEDQYLYGNMAEVGVVDLVLE